LQLTRAAFPKISLVGHPSDGYGGGTLALTVKNFAAIVTAKPGRRMEIGVRLGASHNGPQSLVNFTRRYGYPDATRLMLAALVRLVAWCEARGIGIEDKACALSLRTTIPRQVGMGGSSAIVRATLDALCGFYAIAIPLRDRVTLALETETVELGIEAGLVDRVVQVFDGAIHFQCEDATGWSATRVDAHLLPKLFVAYRSDLAKISSGGVLSPIGARFRAGDRDIVAIMAELRELAKSAADDLRAGRIAPFLARMDRGMDLRVKLMPQLDSRYFELADIGRTLRAHVTFTGSGGAVVGTFENRPHFIALKKAYGEVDATVIAVTPSQPRPDSDYESSGALP
jgi:glucuronokinase